MANEHNSISSSEVLALVKSDEEFPVDFEKVWGQVGYSTKQKAKFKLVENFVEGVDYTYFKKTKPSKNGGGSTLYDEINLTFDCLIGFLIVARTPKSNQLLLEIFSHLLNRNFDRYAKNASDDPSGFVYLVKTSPRHFYKIGKSKHPYRRLQTLQTGNAVKLDIIERVFSFDCHALESALHNHYSRYWIRGEWYRLNDKIVKDFLRIANELDKQQEQLLIEAVPEDTPPAS